MIFMNLETEGFLLRPENSSQNLRGNAFMELGECVSSTLFSRITVGRIGVLEVILKSLDNEYLSLPNGPSKCAKDNVITQALNNT